MKERYASEARHIIEEVVERGKIRKPGHLADVVDVLASNIGSLTNPLNLENTFKTVKREVLKSKTIASYIGKLRDAYLVYSLKSQGCQPRPRKSRTCGRWALAASRPAS